MSINDFENLSKNSFICLKTHRKVVLFGVFVGVKIGLEYGTKTCLTWTKNLKKISKIPSCKNVFLTVDTS